MTIPSLRVDRLSSPRVSAELNQRELSRTVDHCSVLFPAPLDSFQATFPIYPPWTHLHHEPVKGRTPWTTLLKTRFTSGDVSGLYKLTLNQNMSRSLSAARRAFTMTKNRCASTSRLLAEAAFGSERTWPAYMCNGWS